MAAYGFTYNPRKGPIRTRSVSPTTASAGQTSKLPAMHRGTGRYGKTRAETARYKAAQGAYNSTKAEVLKALGLAVQPQGGGGPAGLGPGGTTTGFKLPKVPVEPVAGNPYAGLEAKIGRFAQASAKRQRGDTAAAKRALAGRADPGRGITGSFDAQAAGMAGELAAAASSLKNQARAQFAEAELERRGQLAKNKFDARSQQIKSDATLMEQMGSGMLSPSLAAQLEAEGIDSTQFANNPMGASIILGRVRYARRNEAGQLPPTAWAQAAQYGLAPPNTFGTAQEFYQALGQAKSGTYGGGSDAFELLQALEMSGLLQGMGS